MPILRRLLFLILLISSAFSVARADALDDLENEMTGVWLVKVTGEDRTRTLKIYGLDSRSGKGFLLEADYGWSTGAKTPIVAEVIEADQQRKLLLTTQPGSKVVATQGSDGKFSGTFTPKNGVAKGVTIEKVTPDEFEIIQRTELNAVPKIEQPSADVPSSCASFVGGWTGTLPNAGRLWLWVVAMDSKCVATFYYGSSAGVPKEFKMGEIRNGVLTIPRPSGKATFEVKGSELVRRFFGSEGVSSPVAMQKVNTSDGSIEKLRADQAADRPIAIPPGPNVPAACAAFFGTWVGTWARGNQQQSLLHVFAVDAKCFASYSYTALSAPKNFHRAQIKGGFLSFRCNTRSSTICSFRRSGNALNAEGIVGSGNPDTAVFTKVQ